MNTKKHMSYQKGIAPFVLIIIVVALLIVGGTVYFAVLKKSPAEQDAAQKTETEQKKAEAEKAVDDVSVEVPSLDLSGSPMPNLELSALNVSAPDAGMGNVFSSGVFVDSNFSAAADTTIAAPELKLDIPTMTQPEIPSGGTQPSPAPSEQPSGGTQPSVDCSQFSAVPSCSYVGGAGSPGYTACKQCFPNK